MIKTWNGSIIIMDTIMILNISILVDETNRKKAVGANAVCISVNDDANRAVLQSAGLNTHLALRCAGFNNVV